MLAQCSILQQIWHLSRTSQTQELQNVSAVLNSEEDVAWSGVVPVLGGVDA